MPNPPFLNVPTSSKSSWNDEVDLGQNSSDPAFVCGQIFACSDHASSQTFPPPSLIIDITTRAGELPLTLSIPWITGM
jgi:hypothetical protein